MSIIVLTNPTNGWDCVLGVYYNLESAWKDQNIDSNILEIPSTKEILKYFEDNDIIVHKNRNKMNNKPKYSFDEDEEIINDSLVE